VNGEVLGDAFGDCAADRAGAMAPPSGESPDGPVLSGDEVQDRHAAAATACSAIRILREVRFEKRILITIPFLECSAV
jgi:hypothetical protein